MITEVEAEQRFLRPWRTAKTWSDLNLAEIAAEVGYSSQSAMAALFRRLSSASAFEIIGDVYSLVGEPRMIYLSARYGF